MEFNGSMINTEKKEKKNSEKIKNLQIKKANRIHLELLSFVISEINKTKNKFKSSFSYSIFHSSDKEQTKSNNSWQQTNESYNGDNEDEELEDNSSDMSCEEEIII